MVVNPNKILSMASRANNRLDFGRTAAIKVRNKSDDNKCVSVDARDQNYHKSVNN